MRDLEINKHDLALSLMSRLIRLDFDTKRKSNPGKIVKRLINPFESLNRASQPAKEEETSIGY